MEGNDEDSLEIKFYNKSFVSLLDMPRNSHGVQRTIYWHMQKTVDLVAKLENTLKEYVVILDGLGQDTSINIFEFNPLSSTSSEPS